MKHQKRIILTGGGTAGHVTPQIALLPLLRVHGFDIRYIGSSRGIERELIEKEGVPYYAVPAGKLRRYADIKNVTDVVRIQLGLLKSLYIVGRLRPQILFSKGGFVSCPVVWAAWLWRVPVIIHESDISPGLANRLSLPFAGKICFSFPETASHLPPEKAVLTGIPVRRSLLQGSASQGKALCGFTDDKPVILVTGGSQGAAAVNACLRSALDSLLPTFNVCHLCGRGNLAPGRPGYAQFEYVTDELPHLFALADIAVSRAGATTLFELAALAKPSLLIPLPLSASRGDQIANARSFEKQGICRVLPQESMTPETLPENIRSLFEHRSEVTARMKSSVAPDAAGAVVSLIEETVSERPRY